jgi:hypothetical protein
MTGEQIDFRHQGQGAVALVLVMAHHGRADAGNWRAIRRGGTDRLNPWFLVVRDDREAPATAVLALVLPAFSLATRHRHLPRCCGLELDPAYVDTTIRRWQALTGGSARHAASNRSFDDLAREAEATNAA